MTAEALVQTLFGTRLASKYVFSLPPGEFEQYLESHRIPSFVASEDDPETYRLAGVGHHPIVYLEHRVAFESDVPQRDVLFCLELVRRNPLPPPKALVAFVNERQSRALRRNIRLMCIARTEPKKEQVTAHLSRFIYDCRAGERWVEIYFAKEPIPVLGQLSV